MTINLDTGSIQGGLVPHPSLGVVQVTGNLIETDDTTPSETIVYPSEHRQLLVVEPASILVVTGYNLGTNSKVLFRKTLRSQGIPISGTASCCPTMTVAHAVRLHSTEIPCWSLEQGRPIFVIKTPGCYELDVIGDNIEVVVTAMTFPAQEVNDFSKCSCNSGNSEYESL